MNELVDIGANLTGKAFRGDVDDVIARARAAGVTRIVVTGTSVAGSYDARELAQRHAGTLWSTAGIHPHNARELDAPRLAELRHLAAQPGVVAVGECGLDYNRNFSPPAAQRACFEAQLELAATLGKPVFLHQRDAHDDFVAILKNALPRLRAAVVHCFTGGAAELDAYLALDLHVGITGWICDERRGRHLASLVARIAADRLMLETDAPYLLPRTLKVASRRNEPAYLPHVLAEVARCRGEEPAHVAAITTATARAFFGLA
jgi:TatD DNase family protein